MKSEAIDYVLWLMSDSPVLGFPELGRLMDISKKYPRLFKRALDVKGGSK